MTNGETKQCERCGCDIVVCGRRKYCDSCAKTERRAYLKDYNVDYKAKQRAEAKKPVLENIDTLGLKAAEAKALGISYGQMQKMLFFSQMERVRV